MESRLESTIAEWVRNHKTQATVAMGVFLLVVVLLVTPPRRASLPPEVSLAGPVSELLADVRGQDVLERLRVGQAAMRQELAWVRYVLASAEGVSSAETDLLRAFAELQAEHAALEGMLRFLQAGHMRVESMVIRYHIGLEDLSERLDGLDPAGERN